MVVVRCVSTTVWSERKSMARKLKPDERTSEPFMKGYKDGSAQRPKNNPYSDPTSRHHIRYNEGYAAGTAPSKYEAKKRQLL